MVNERQYSKPQHPISPTKILSLFRFHSICCFRQAPAYASGDRSGAPIAISIFQHKPHARAQRPDQSEFFFVIKFSSSTNSESGTHGAIFSGILNVHLSIETSSVAYPLSAHSHSIFSPKSSTKIFSEFGGTGNSIVISPRGPFVRVLVRTIKVWLYNIYM